MYLLCIHAAVNIPTDGQRGQVLKDSSSEIRQLQNRIDSMAAEKIVFQQRIEVLFQEKDQYTEQVEQQKLRLQKQIEYQKNEIQLSKQQLMEKEQQVCQLKSEKQQYETDFGSRIESCSKNLTLYPEAVYHDSPKSRYPD